MTGGFFGRLLGRGRRGTLPRDIARLRRHVGPPEDQDPDSYPGAVYKKGDVIGRIYEVYGVLGVGGFSVVYLAHSRETDSVVALKTLRDEYQEDRDSREQFRKEATLWVNLKRHPNLVSAHFIEELSGRLYIGMEYIEPNDEGLNSLEGYLEHRPPDLIQSLRWAIQFCHGMESAGTQGIRSHRDVKPANIMITREGQVKITDFGFADVIDPSRKQAVFDGMARARRGTEPRFGFGTPSYMPPEQFVNPANCDARSDIYSFGVVLYQLATRGRLPFAPKVRRRRPGRNPPSIWKQMHRLHTDAPLPPLRSPLFPILRRCLQKEQRARYQTFSDLRHDLELLLLKNGEELEAPSRSRKAEAWEIYNRAFSLAQLGNYEDAIRHYDMVLELEPQNTDAWNNRGVCCKKLGKNEDALICYENAIRVDRHNASAWTNKGNILYATGRYSDALVSLTRAVRIDTANETAWLNKALAEERLGLNKEAASSYRRYLDTKPQESAEHVAYARRRLKELGSRSHPRTS